MAGLSTYAETALMNHGFRNQTYTPAATVYCRLYSVLPNDDGTGGTEMVGTGYAAQSVAFAAYSSRRVANSGTITFTNSGVSTWPTAIGFGIADAASGGNILATGSLVPQASITAGNSLALLAGEIYVQMGKAGPYLAQKALELMFRNTAWTSPTTIYAALCSTAFDDDGAGGTELSASGYTRKATAWSAPSSKRMALSSSVSFTSAAPAAWGTIPAVAYYDASTAGNFMLQQAISPVPTIAINAPYALAATATYIGLD